MSRRGPSPIDAHVGQRLHQRRTDYSIPLAAVGKAIGVSPQQIWKYEIGKDRIGASRLYHLAYQLGVSVDYFFEGLT